MLNEIIKQTTIMRKGRHSGPARLLSRGEGSLDVGIIRMLALMLEYRYQEGEGWGFILGLERLAKRTVSGRT